jgi:Spy/CpxP family protein refolding chaperone
MKTTTQFAAITLAALTLAVAGAVSAHPGSGMGAGYGPGAGAGPCAGAGPGAGPGYGMGYGMHGRGPGGWDAAAVGTRLDALKAEIKITPEQEGAWQAYAAVVQQHAVQREALHTQMQAQMHDPQAAATVDREAFHNAMVTLREQHLAERDAALKGLYAVLTPEQKALAEQKLAGGYGHGWAMRQPRR